MTGEYERQHEERRLEQAEHDQARHLECVRATITAEGLERIRLKAALAAIRMLLPWAYASVDDFPHSPGKVQASIDAGRHVLDWEDEGTTVEELMDEAEATYRECDGDNLVICGYCNGGGTSEHPCYWCGNSGEEPSPECDTEKEALREELCVCDSCPLLIKAENEAADSAGVVLALAAAVERLIPIADAPMLLSRCDRQPTIDAGHAALESAKKYQGITHRGPAQVGRSGSGETGQPGSRPSETGSGGPNQAGRAALDSNY